MIVKTILMIVALCNVFQLNDSETVVDTPVMNATIADSISEPFFGYKNDEVTQGVGYGHHLHPFYYQGKLQRFYNCAVEEEWNPYSKTTQPTLTLLHVKVDKRNIPKKYTSQREKTVDPKLKVFTKRRDGVIRRSSRIMTNEFLMNPHTRFIKDINSMSEMSDNNVHRYEYDQPSAQIIVPPDAEILIVKKRPSGPLLLTPVENVILAPPSIKPVNRDEVKSGTSKVITNYYNKPPNSFDNDGFPFKKALSKKPMNPIAQEINEASQPYKFVTPFIEDMFRTKYKKPQKIMQVKFNPRQSPVAASSSQVYKTKRLAPSPTKPPSKMSFWEKFVLTFFRLV